jgi:hypothetical protein
VLPVQDERLIDYLYRGNRGGKQQDPRIMRIGRPFRGNRQREVSFSHTAGLVLIYSLALRWLSADSRAVARSG